VDSSKLKEEVWLAWERAMVSYRVRRSCWQAEWDEYRDLQSRYEETTVMGKFGCTCGNAISLNSIPEFNEAILITDIALDNTAGENVSADRQPKRFVYECDQCGRLWIQKDPESDYWISFVPEAGSLNFRDDYGKGFRAEPPESEDEDLFEVKPEEIVERHAVVTLRAKIIAGYRGVVATHPLEYMFKPERAIVPPNTPNEILLHSPCLMDPTPINLILSEESGRLRLQRPLFKPRYEKGEKVEFDVENTLNEDFELTIGVVGRVSTADMPIKVPGEPPS
jgi:hypothetical protein